MIIVVFGFPGSGKTFVGKIISKKLEYFFYDGDASITPEIIQAIQQKQIISDAMRDVFFSRLITDVKKLHKIYPNIVVAQTFIKEKYRKRFLQEFPETQFILTEAEAHAREERIEKRKIFKIDKDYARAICYIFERTLLPHLKINNSKKGAKAIEDQVNAILKKHRFDNFSRHISL